MSTHTIVTHVPILVTKSGEEGGFHVYPIGNGDTGSFQANSLPDWAADEQIVSANLKGLREWLTQRIGDDSYGEMKEAGTLSTLDFDLLDWTCITDTEELVERPANLDARAEWLADLVGLEDRSVEAFDAIKPDAEAIHKSYAETQTDERSLAEAEGKTFEEVARIRATG